MSVCYKVVLNGSYGGFSLSKSACELFASRYGVYIDPEYGFINDWDESGRYEYIPRHDRRLVDVVETLGWDRASGSNASLYVVEINQPMYKIKEYDGNESIVLSDDDWIYID